jgi:hypothetical protein
MKPIEYAVFRMAASGCNLLSNGIFQGAGRPKLGARAFVRPRTMRDLRDAKLIGQVPSSESLRGHIYLAYGLSSIGKRLARTLKRRYVLDAYGAVKKIEGGTR